MENVWSLSLSTIRNYEVDGRYPKRREVYAKLTAVLGCEINFLLSEDEDLVQQARQTYGRKGVKDAAELVVGVSALFAGGELPKNDKDAVTRALLNAYWMAKERNKEKNASKKRRKE